MEAAFAELAKCVLCERPTTGEIQIREGILAAACPEHELDVYVLLDGELRENAARHSQPDMPESIRQIALEMSQHIDN